MFAQSTGTIWITDFLSIVYFKNRGVSFGLLADQIAQSAAIFAALSAVLGFALLIMAIRASRFHEIAGFAMIAGGAFGNAFDRFWFGAVTDFIDFHVAGWHWPAFNFADISIVIGAGLVLVGGFVRAPRPINENRA
ncbi:MAG: signal peptidase II [Aestuariivirga sp.]